jgi:hypothetical protein
MADDEKHIVFRKPERKVPLAMSRHRWENNIKVHFKEIIVRVPALKPWKECGKYEVGGGHDTQRPGDWF